MLLFGNKRNKKALETEVAAVHFVNPVGIVLNSNKLRENLSRCFQAGFVTLSPPREGTLNWIRSLQAFRSKTVLAVNLHTDIVSTFSLVYDFADIIILDPDSDNGIDSPDIADTAALLEDVVSLRLCYENYTPVFLRLTHAVTPDELHPLLGQSRLYGLDGVVACSLSQLRLVVQETQGRLPVIGMAEDADTAAEMLRTGASLVETNLHSFQVNKLLKQLQKQES